MKKSQGATKRRASLVALAMTAVPLAGVTVAASPAQAVCYETNYSASVSVYIGGVKRGVENTRSPETCNRNGVYYGKISDTYTDGSCLSIRYYDPSYVGTQGTSCDSAGYNYTFWDQNGDTIAGFRGQLVSTGALSPLYEHGAY
ncbi:MULTISPECIES: hypothetical protein [unclassified Micromonospora]|uniref:hypothetical protein n=1 Tax=unclassified Micromonospora TaxID=2617518 RepID=UPI000EF46325|nr:MULTISPECIES: hypothetical protein [unclassified Micromonospora]RLP92090.1 hypothetical protein EAD89_09720 [Micromonospora sp. BL4]RLP97821.1 hypothetical protein EAD98_06150 [Micromonospora sp. CV4]